MALLRIPALDRGRGFFLPPAEPSLLSTTKPSSRRHEQFRTRRVRWQVIASGALRALIVDDSYTRDLHRRTETWSRG